MEINYFLVALLIASTVYLIIQSRIIKQQDETIKNGNYYYKKLHNENVIITKEFERAKKTIVHQENVIKYFCRLVDEVPEIEKAYNDLIGGNEKL